MNETRASLAEPVIHITVGAVLPDMTYAWVRAEWGRSVPVTKAQEQVIHLTLSALATAFGVTGTWLDYSS